MFIRLTPLALRTLDHQASQGIHLGAGILEHIGGRRRGASRPCAKTRSDSESGPRTRSNRADVPHEEGKGYG